MVFTQRYEEYNKHAIAKHIIYAGDDCKAHFSTVSSQRMLIPWQTKAFSLPGRKMFCQFDGAALVLLNHLHESQYAIEMLGNNFSVQPPANQNAYYRKQNIHTDRDGQDIFQE